MTETERLYSFVMRGLLTEEALDAAGRKRTRSEFEGQAEVESLLQLGSLDQQHVASVKDMSVVYVAVAAFERSVRELISKTLLENKGEGWWQTCVSEKIRSLAQTRIDEEEKVRWHSTRGADPINYTMLPNLLNIIRQNIGDFEPFIHNIDWAAQIFESVERSRNVIMHSGQLSRRDVARLGSLLSDWSKQVAV